MKLDFIPLIVSLTVLSFIAAVNAQGKARKAPIEGSGSGLGPGVDDEDRGGQLPAGGSLLPKPPKKKKTMKPPPPMSPSDRNRWSSPLEPTSRSAAGNSGGAPPTPEVRSWSGTKTHPPLRSGNDPRPPSQPLPGGRASRPQLPQQGDEGSGMPGNSGPQAPPDQESVARKQPPMEMLPTMQRKPNTFAAPPVPCKEAQKLRTGLNYYARCDRDGYYERRQCSQDDCMCVDRNTGIVLEKTVALRAKNISCDEVSYIVQVPLKYPIQSNDDPDLLQRKIIGQLENLLDNLPGEQRLLFQRYLPYQSPQFPISGLELLCTSIGHSDPSALARFLHAQAAKGSSLPLVSRSRPLNVTRLGPSRDSPAVENVGVGKNSHNQYKSGKDTKAEMDPSAARNDEGQGGMRKKKSGAAAFLQQPGIIAAIIGGGIAGFFLAILLILFCIYRIRKKDEGSYALEEPKKMPVSAAVYHSAPTREYYA